MSSSLFIPIAPGAKSIGKGPVPYFIIPNWPTIDFDTITAHFVRLFTFNLNSLLTNFQISELRTQNFVYFFNSKILKQLIFLCELRVKYC